MLRRLFGLFAGFSMLIGIAGTADADTHTTAERIEMATLYRTELPQDLVEAVDRLPWMSDGLTDLEKAWLDTIVSVYLKHDEQLVRRILNSPSLQSVESHDVGALDTLYPLDRMKAVEVFDRLSAKGGLTDCWATILTATHPLELEVMEELLSRPNCELKSHVSTLPYSGEVEFVVVTSGRGLPNASIYLEWFTRGIEGFMKSPLPTNQIVLMVQNESARANESGRLRGEWRDHSVLVTLGRRVTGILFHEIAHYYFNGFGPVWMYEGGAVFMQHWWDSIWKGIPLRLRSCEVETLAETELSGPRDTQLSFHPCAYPIGGNLYVELYELLGEEKFRRSVSALREQARITLPALVTLADFKQAFGAENGNAVEQLIDKWYCGVCEEDT